MSSKTVLITGCSSGGIGHALALAFQERGCTVFATARTVKKIQDLASLPDIHLIALDVTVSESVADAAKEIEKQTSGKLDISINNAGSMYAMPILDDEVETAKKLFEVNYWGPIRMTKVFSPMLIKAKGTIVNVGSVAGVLALPFQSKPKAD